MMAQDVSVIRSTKRNHPMSSLRDHIERTLRDTDSSSLSVENVPAKTGSITLPEGQ